MPHKTVKGWDSSHSSVGSSFYHHLQSLCWFIMSHRHVPNRNWSNKSYPGSLWWKGLPILLHWLRCFLSSACRRLFELNCVGKLLVQELSPANELLERIFVYLLSPFLAVKDLLEEGKVCKGLIDFPSLTFSLCELVLYLGQFSPQVDILDWEFANRRGGN